MPRWPLSLGPRFWSKVDRSSSECWIWTAAVTNAGYGKFKLPRDGKSISAHRLALLLTDGPVPDGMEVDHLCRNRRCVNPAHLEIVSREENQRRSREDRGYVTTTGFCGRGHPLTASNTTGPRKRCLTCARDYYAKSHGRGTGSPS